jgi:2-succinyl-5-enolpyruvyl-6-hydroxy-3-cyclohexene-1-carboxylate synthase
MDDSPAAPAPGGHDPDASEPAGVDVNVAVTFCATLVDEWVRRGLRHAVVAPGSRSTPMATALAGDERVAVHVVLDERAAAFTALGVGAATGVPAVLLCTSGTAAAEFHAAVVEAHQAAVPMLVITADRPPELQGVWAPQTIDQRELFGGAPRWYCEPGPPTIDGAPWWRDLADDAFDRALGVTPGPVHLNLAFREPLSGPVGDLPPVGERAGATVTPGAPWGVPDEELARLASACAGRRGVIVAGARATVDGADVDALLGLADALGWPVLCDAPSGCRVPRPGVVSSFDPLLRDPVVADALRPDVALRVGGLLSSKVLQQWLTASGAVQVGVDRADRVPDPDRVLARSIPADPATVCRQLLAVGPAPAPSDWRARWEALEVAGRTGIDASLAGRAEVSEPAVAIDTLAALPDGSSLVVSSSMPVRDVEWYAPPRSGVRVLANRGANGIDGVVSTALGVALATGPTAVLVGDLAFLHDSTALISLRDRDVDLVIVVVDNDGGGIFSFLPQRDHLPDATFEQLFGTPHGTDLVALAAAHGLDAERVASRTGVQAAIAGALTRGGVRVVVAESDRAVNVEVHREINESVARAAGAVLDVVSRGPGARGNAASDEPPPRPLG